MPLPIDGIAADVSTATGLQTIVDAVRFRWDALDVLVNNAGTNIRRPTVDYSPEQARQILETNFMSAFELSRALHPQLCRGAGASVINVASVAGWFGQEARLRYLPWDAWRATVSEDEARATWDHIAHSPNCSIEKARHHIDYQPRYTSFQAVREAMDWLIEHEGLLAQ